MAQKKIAIGVLVLLLILGGAIAFIVTQKEAVFDLAMQSKEEGYHEDDATASEVREVDAAELTEGQTDLVAIDVEAALTERVIGTPEAPIKISEHSSLTCGHCGNFHKRVFKEFKENWLDTGKAYLVFSDFPLNGPALRASMAARCVKDDDQYHALLAELFETQDDWAYGSDFLTPLKATVAKYGVDGNMFKACIQNKELETGLLDRIRAAQQQYGVNSTPSFVINNAVTISGGSSYEEFNKALEEAVAQSNEPAEGTP